ncbi:MAG: MXAN_6577-like cysteine-rich protein [Deltaproteobacteria bacterium]|nr:MXAN_6577-like cysteine-rich protein [Deltaproteobacteria bacterium]
MALTLCGAQMAGCAVGRSVLAGLEAGATDTASDSTPDTTMREDVVDMDATTDIGPDVADDTADSQVASDGGLDVTADVAADVAVDVSTSDRIGTGRCLDAATCSDRCPDGDLACVTACGAGLSPTALVLYNAAINCLRMNCRDTFDRVCWGAQSSMGACVAQANACFADSADGGVDSGTDSARDAADAADTFMCPAPQMNCSGVCINTTTNTSHCGACNNMCPVPANATAGCTASVCGIGACRTGFGNCDGNAANGCEVNLPSDRANCGACGNVCPVGASCTAGVCACPLGTVNCGGACVNVSSDTNHCGACGVVCPGLQVCATGVCRATCASGETLCGVQCVQLGSDVNNCGACGNRCPSSSTCASGVCVPVVSVDPIGCADGTREAFADRTMFPNIAACSGPWGLPGIFPSIPAAPLAVCATLGNSSLTAPVNGAGCSSSNLCARGWHICNGGEVSPRTASMGCAASTYPAGTFFAAAVSGTGCGRCALRTGTVTGAMCTSSSCTADCRESGDLNNDLFGCGAIGSGVTGACDRLDRSSGNNCGSIPAPWVCGGDVMESRTVTKIGSAAGGVLCCRD